MMSRSTYGTERKCIIYLVEDPEERRPYGRPRTKWYYDIKTSLINRVEKCWMDLSGSWDREESRDIFWDREESRDILKKLLKIWVSENVGNFLTKDFVSTVLDTALCRYLVSYLGPS